MKILTVTYRANLPQSNYRTEHVEATAEVQKGETAEEAFAAVRDFVRKQLGLDLSSEEIERAEAVLARAKALRLR